MLLHLLCIFDAQHKPKVINNTSFARAPKGQRSTDKGAHVLFLAVTYYASKLQKNTRFIVLVLLTILSAQNGHGCTLSHHRCITFRGTTFVESAVLHLLCPFGASTRNQCKTFGCTDFTTTEDCAYIDLLCFVALYVLLALSYGYLCKWNVLKVTMVTASKIYYFKEAKQVTKRSSCASTVPFCFHIATITTEELHRLFSMPLCAEKAWGTAQPSAKKIISTPLLCTLITTLCLIMCFCIFYLHFHLCNLVHLLCFLHLLFASLRFFARRARKATKSLHGKHAQISFLLAPVLLRGMGHRRNEMVWSRSLHLWNVIVLHFFEIYGNLRLLWPTVKRFLWP